MKNDKDATSTQAIDRRVKLQAREKLVQIKKIWGTDSPVISEIFDLIKQAGWELPL
jgi:hypothetical protein